MREWRLAALAFAAAAAFFTAAGFLPGRVMLPVDLPRDSGAWKANPDERVVVSNRLLSDSVLEFRAWDHEVRRQLARGQFPWRNVWAGDGAHLFANPEASLLFPLTWGRIALGDRGWAVDCFLKLFLAGLGMWWLARVATECAWRSALVGGIVYMTCGYMTVWLLSPHTNVYAMLPWLAAALLAQRRGLTLLFAALATAGGHPETLFYGVVAIIVYLLIARRRGPALLYALFGFLIVAVQIVPFVPAAARSDLLAQRLGTRSPTRLFAMPATLLPGYLGSPLAGEIDLSGAVPGGRGENFNERAGGYAGLAALILVLVAWRRVPRAALAIALAALVLSWHLPLLRIIDRLPGATARLGLVFAFFIAMCVGPALDHLRVTCAAWLLAALGVVLCAAGVFLALPIAQPLVARAARAGIAMLQQRGFLRLPGAVYELRLAGYLAGFAAVALRRIAIPGFCLVVLAVAFRRRSRALAAAAVVIEMLVFAYGYNPAVPIERAAPAPPMIAAVQRLDPDHRFLIAAAPDVYPPNLGTIDLVRDIRSYDVLQSHDRIAVLRKLGYDPETRAFPDPPPPQLAQLGVRWFLTQHGLVELPNAVPQPWPANAPPPGVRAGLAVSVFMLLAALATLVFDIESFFAERHEHDGNTPG